MSGHTRPRTSFSSGRRSTWTKYMARTVRKLPRTRMDRPGATVPGRIARWRPTTLSVRQSIALKAAVLRGVRPPSGGQADLLPNEPGGYTGYQALFGSKYITLRSAILSDYNGNAISGFPGKFSPIPAHDARDSGVDAEERDSGGFRLHRRRSRQRGREGSGYRENLRTRRGSYVQQLKDYDTAFATFFAEP